MALQMDIPGSLQFSFQRSQIFPTVAVLIDIDGIHNICLAIVTTSISSFQGYIVLQALESQQSDIFYLSLPTYDFPRTRVVFTRMEIIHNHGFRLLSPSMQDLQSMPLPPRCPPLNHSNYIGGRHDIYPPLSNGLGHVLWYMGVRYFHVAGHVTYSEGFRLDIWNGSYIRFQRSDGVFQIGEVIECLVDSSNGNPFLIGRVFYNLLNVQSLHYNIPDFVHCPSNGRRCMNQEIFYTTSSFICEVHSVVDIIDVFFTRYSYELWSGRIPRHRAYFCEFMLDSPSTHPIWHKLAISGPSPVVLRRLASSQAFSRHGVLPQHVGIPQPHVHIIVFITSLSRAVYDRVISPRHIGLSKLNSYIEVLCDSDTWNGAIGPLIPHGQLQHHTHCIQLNVNGYDILHERIFYSWVDFPDRILDAISDQHLHPHRVRVDPTMTFSFYGQSPRAPRLRVGFTWDTYAWNPIQKRYESLGLVNKHFTL